MACALGGLLGLLLPGISAPPLHGAALMLVAGIAWGVYSLRGKGAGDPLQATAGNFLRAVPFAAALSLAMLPWAALDRRRRGPAPSPRAPSPRASATPSGTRALRGLKAASAATVQLSVPPLAALGGVVLLGEPLTLRLLLASVAILGGIALVTAEKRRRRLTRRA